MRKLRPFCFCGASNISLAVLETFVHLKAGGLPPNRYLVELTIPDAVWKRAASLAPPVGWDATPAGKVSLDEGERWLRSGRSPALIVPSAIVDEEYNVLINPPHPDARQIAARKLRKWTCEPRLMRLPA